MHLALVDCITDKAVYAIKVDRTPALYALVNRLQDECCPGPGSVTQDLQTPLDSGFGDPPEAPRCGQFCSVGADCTVDANCPSCYHASPTCRWQKCRRPRAGSSWLEHADVD